MSESAADALSERIGRDEGSSCERVSWVGGGRGEGGGKEGGWRGEGYSCGCFSIEKEDVEDKRREGGGEGGRGMMVKLHPYLPLQ